MPSTPIQLLPHPAPLTWQVPPLEWTIDKGTLQVTAGPRTDMFASPSGEAPVLNAPRLLGPIAGDFQLSARVTVNFQDTYDAGVLLIWRDEQTWAKLCFEYSPQRDPMIVSVVTRGSSDDANSFVVAGNTAWLRISRLGQSALAFHASADGKAWSLVRHFGLEMGEAPLVGFEAQSPVGEGCSVRFEKIGYSPTRLNELRSGE